MLIAVRSIVKAEIFHANGIDLHYNLNLNDNTMKSPPPVSSRVSENEAASKLLG